MKADVGDWRVIKSGTVGHRDRSKRPFSQAIPGRSGRSIAGRGADLHAHLQARMVPRHRAPARSATEELGRALSGTCGARRSPPAPA
jgi:hypothetical protein